MPIGLVALGVAWLRLPTAPGHEAPRPDPLPALLATTGVGALTLAIVKGADWGWASPVAAFTFAVAFACGAAFLATPCARPIRSSIPRYSAHARSPARFW